MATKVTKFIVALILLMSVCSGACAQQTGFIGSWRLIAFEGEGVSISAEDLEESFVLIFGEDGKLELGEDGDDLASLEWKMQDGAAVFGEDGEVYTCVLDGDTLAMATDYGTMVFGRKSAGTSAEKDETSGAGPDSGEPADAVASPRMNTPAVLEPGDVIGAWTLDALETGGESVAAAVAGLDLMMKLNEDRSAMMILSGKEADKPGTWAITDGKLHLLAGGSDHPMVFTPIDGNLVADEDGTKMIFGKAEGEEAEAAGLPGLPSRTEDSGGQPPVLPGGPTGLKNYEEWLQPYVEVMPMQNMLEQWISTEDIGDGLVKDAIDYPRAWPAELLGGAIPEYTGDGWMYDLYVSHPNMSYAAKDITYLALTIYEYREDDLGAYIGSLTSYGYGEVFSGEYYDSIVSQCKAVGGDAVRCFEKGDCFVSLMTGHGQGGMIRIGFSEDIDDLPFLDIAVNFLDRGSYAMNSAATPGTGLLNFEQAGRPGSVEAGYGTAMDNIVETFADQYGRHNTTLLLPSAWPGDVFGELIPEYVSAGVLSLLHRTEPEEEAGTGRTLLATLYILEYRPSDVDAYIEAVKAFGYRELPASYYAESQAAAAAQSNRYQAFKLPGIMLTITESTYKGNDELSIGLSWEGRTRNYFASLGY